MTKSSAAVLGGNVQAFDRLGPIDYRDPNDLKFYACNPRRHSQRQLTKIAASIGEFGFVVPVLVTSDGELITGEARVAAAKQAGLTSVPTIGIHHLSEAQVKAFRLADNRLADLAEWDLESLAAEIEEILATSEVQIDILGWDTAELDVILADAGGTTASQSDPADEIVQPPTQPVSRTGDIWSLGKHRLLCGSSLESDAWHTLMDGALAVMAFIDPPYNVPVAGHVSGLGKVQHAEFAMASGEMSRAAFTDFLATFLGEMTSHLSDGAISHVCMDWRHLPELLGAGQTAELQLINLCVWNKTNGGMGSLYRSKHELVLVFKKGRAKHINNVELGKHGRYRTNVWDYAGVNTFGAGRMADLEAHPTVKPIALVADAIRDVSRHGDIVLDAFMGSGTTILAAERAGRVAYGIEIDPGYVDVALQRWEKMTGTSAVLQSTGQSFAEVAAARAEKAAVTDAA